MREAIAFSEGSARLWTGSAAHYGFALAQSVNVSFGYGWNNFQTLDGTYRNLLTGQRADVTIAAAQSYDMAIFRMFQSATAIHMELWHGTPISVSAGWVLWSGRIDQLQIQGQQGDVLRYNLTYHANVWSGYGSAYP